MGCEPQNLRLQHFLIRGHLHRKWVTGLAKGIIEIRKGAHCTYGAITP